MYSVIRKKHNTNFSVIPMSKWRDKKRLKKAKKRDELLRTQILASLSTTNEKGLLCFLLIFQNYLPLICEFPYIDDYNFFCNEGITCGLLLTDGERRFLVIQIKYFEDILTSSRRSRSYRLRETKWQARECQKSVYINKQKSAGYVDYSVFTNEFRDFPKLDLSSKFDQYCQIVFDENMKESSTHKIIERLKEEITLPPVTIRSEKRSIEEPKYTFLESLALPLFCFSTFLALVGILLVFVYPIFSLLKLFYAGLIVIGIGIILYLLFWLILFLEK